MAIPMTIEVEFRKAEYEGKSGWFIEPKNRDANTERFKGHQEEFNEKWKKRNPKKNPPDPNKHDAHLPVVFKEGETVKFTCPAGFRFAIGAKKSSDVDEFAGAPDNPFGWHDLQIGVENGGSVSAVVIATANGPGPRHQAFYKFHGWVLEKGEFEPADPDGYCGG